MLFSRPNLITQVVEFGDCPAKTWETPDGLVLGRSVQNHCQIVGEVARELIRRSPISFLFPSGSAFVAAAHDIGKVSPSFYNKLMRACKLDQLSGSNPDLEYQWGGHAGVSQVSAQAMGVPNYVPEILGQHHGFLPQVGSRRADDEQFGGPLWQREREKLVATLEEELRESWPEVESFAESRMLAGLTSVADWIGSGQYFEDPQAPWQENISRALDDAGFVQASYRNGLSFEQIFGFSPWEAQRQFFGNVTGPGVYVLEAPMGLGKTEAALYAAYQILAAGQASGVYFALPTQLTSNKIHQRFEHFLTQILAPDCPHRALLLHANAWLQEFEMGEEGRPGGAWFNQAKRGLLAPFAVGTIDQALMAAMNVKHGFVRAFGLAGKVVILDEVHSYDAYTGTLLDALIRLLRQLHCTVIVLSATLSRERREHLLEQPSPATAYPLIVAYPKGSESVREVAVPLDDSHKVRVQLQYDCRFAVAEALGRAEQGQQVLWIENTVAEAQERYLDLAARAADLGVACGLLHSRFTFKHRQKKEDEWVALFGKSGWSQRLKQGRILVGTQVLEQSLDIDADFLVSRFAPTDMVLQRLGRLWRHACTPRVGGAYPEVWLLVPNLAAAVEQPEAYFGASAFVYSPYVLCRSLEVWQGREQLYLPADIRPLIESTYRTRGEEGAMARWQRELEEGNRQRLGRQSLQQLARVTLSETGPTLPENRAQTRYSESDSLEVLLLRSLRLDKSRNCGVLVLLNGEQVELPLNRTRLSRHEWRRRTAQLMSEIVAVRPGDAPTPVSANLLRRYGLQHCFFLGHPDWPEDESLLRVAVVEDSDALKGVEHMKVHDRHGLEYRDDLGYRVLKQVEY